MKTIFTILAILIIYSTQAQNFTFEPSNVMTKTVANAGLTDVRLDIIRTDNIDTLRLEYELLTNSFPAEWYTGYCDNHGCWGSLPESGNMSAMYDEFNSYITLSIDPQEFEGGGTVQYYIYEIGDYDNGQTMTFNVDTPDFVGFNEITTEIDFQFYPNPVQDLLSVKSESNIAKIIVYDLTGKSISQKDVNSSNVKIDAFNWKSGIYFLEVVDIYGNTTTKKFIKQ